MSEREDLIENEDEIGRQIAAQVFGDDPTVTSGPLTEDDLDYLAFIQESMELQWRAQREESRRQLLLTVCFVIVALTAGLVAWMLHQ